MKTLVTGGSGYLGTYVRQFFSADDFSRRSGFDILNEFDASYRQIFLDGRALPVDPTPSWNGYSTAKWDKDTLVVQTAGFRDDQWLDGRGNPLTEAGKITERIRRPNFGSLEIELTVDDPKAYTKPWTVTLKQFLVLDTEMIDEICVEGEKSIQHSVAK